MQLKRVQKTVIETEDGRQFPEENEKEAECHAFNLELTKLIQKSATLDNYEIGHTDISTFIIENASALRDLLNQMLEQR